MKDPMDKAVFKFPIREQRQQCSYYEIYGNRSNKYLANFFRIHKSEVIRGY